MAPDTITTRTPAELRDALLAEVDHLLAGEGLDGTSRSVNPAAYAQVAACARDLAAAADSLDRIVANTPVPLAPAQIHPRFGQAAVDVDDLATSVWNALQEAGHPTKVSDDVVDAIHAWFQPQPA